MFYLICDEISFYNTIIQYHASSAFKNLFKLRFQHESHILSKEAKETKIYRCTCNHLADNRIEELMYHIYQCILWCRLGAYTSYALGIYNHVRNNYTHNFIQEQHNTNECIHGLNKNINICHNSQLYRFY